MTKLKKLDQSLEENLNKKFHNHPLLLTCQQVFRHYMATMDNFDYTSEKLFIEVADVIDNILEAPDDAPVYLDTKWDNLKIKLKQQNCPTPSQNDLNIVCGILFYTVAATMSLHWREYYNTEIVNILVNIVNNEKVFTKIDEERRIIQDLCKHTESLEDWINNYDDCEAWLSDEINDALIVAPEHKTPNLSKNNFKPTPCTFIKTGTVVDANITLMYQYLTEHKWIAQSTTPEEFLSIFSGKTSSAKIKWNKSAGILRDLFKMMIDEKIISCPEGYGYQKIVSSHFIDMDGNYITKINSGYSGKKVQSEISNILILLKTTYNINED